MRLPSLQGANFPAILDWAARVVARYERDYSERITSGQVTLTASDTTTTLSDNGIRPTSKIMLEPVTANAKTARANLYHDTPTLGQVVLNHSSSANTDQTFDYVVINA